MSSNPQVPQIEKMREGRYQLVSDYQGRYKIYHPWIFSSVEQAQLWLDSGGLAEALADAAKG